MQFNDSYAFRGRPVESRLGQASEIEQTLIPSMTGKPFAGVRRCAQCGDLLSKWSESLAGLVLARRRYDLSITYDGIVIASHRFRSLCQDSGLTGLQFKPLPDDPDFVHVVATIIVPFDSVRRGTRFIRQCAVCGMYESVVGATPVYLQQGASVPDAGFARSDLEFGSDDEKHPLLLCGATACAVIAASDVEGVDLIPF